MGSSEPKYGLGELKMVSDITQKLISQGTARCKQYDGMANLSRPFQGTKEASIHAWSR